MHSNPVADVGISAGFLREVAPTNYPVGGGEVMRGDDLGRLWSRFGSELEIFNLYGVAECGTDATAHRISPEDGGDASVSVGEPLDHRHVFIAGQDGLEVPDGQVGELLIGGEAVGTGYPADQALTEERFLFRPADGVYRRGDLARRDPRPRDRRSGRLDHSRR